MLTRDNYIDLYFKEMEDASSDWLCPYYLCMQEDEHYDGFPLQDTLSQQEVLQHIEETLQQLPYMKEQITKYQYALNKLYKKLEDRKEWTLASASQTFEVEEED